MIVYAVLRAIGRLALRWFYRDVEAVGTERIPDRGPVLLASNHPNALVDALVIGCTLRRPVTLTAKATLLGHPITRALLRMTGVVPLQRASDVQAVGTSKTTDPSRNDTAFAAVLDVLESDGIVLLFPEGKSHSDPSLAPLKTGLARIALMARDRGLSTVPIIPVGLTFERKWQPRSRVLMRVGSPIHINRIVPNDRYGVAEITHAIDVGLRDVTLNFGTFEEAQRVVAISSTVAEVLGEFRPLHTPDPPLAVSVHIAQRIAAVAARLPDLASPLRARIEQFLERLDAFEAVLASHDFAASDVQMSTQIAAGVWFGVRETAIGLLGGPFALWGRINHWIPLRIARAIAMKMSRTADEPAMNTIVAGVVAVVGFYVIQIAVIAWQFGWAFASAYAVSLPLSATWDFRYADRVHRGLARVRTYVRLRHDPRLHQQLHAQLDWLRGEAVALDALIGASIASPVSVALPPNVARA
jgi:1-acyl-sn-glycerol-3-phosphate acyltransferase